jgi:2-polyprenyl-3-methyl-5-hydroxy-6-metoxy-1,4-benzoquinol methylase
MKKLESYIAKMNDRVNKVISPKDEMFNYIRTRMPNEESTQSYYFDTGRELAVNLLKYFMDVALQPEKLDFLDFAAGYGRVTRWLAPAFGSVTAADLEQEMIDFQRREYGVNGFVSGDSPQSLETHVKNYDVVFIFSLFTHLPDHTWRAWLRSLAALVRPGGYLIFSAHSYELFAQLNPAKFGDPDKWIDDFLFWETNETNGRLETSVYGCNIVKESYVRMAVDEVPGFELVRRFKKGEFDRYHDIYVIRNTGGVQ